METGQAVMLTGAIVVIGSWVGGKGVTGKMMVGAASLALGLAAMGQANDKLARQFALLILAGAALTYGVSISKALNGKFSGKESK